MNLPITMLERPRARRTDPSTSHRAAQRAVKFANGHKERILDAMRWRALEGVYEVTAEVISEYSGLTVVQIDRRLHEMEGAGLIEQTGQVVNGFRCWRLVGA